MISKKAEIGKNVNIGENATIEDDVIIGDNVTIGSCAFIGNGARISEGVKIFHGAIVSAAPQDLKYKNEPTLCEIGKNTIVRECASVHRGTTYRRKTTVGENCLIMSYAHVAHDCIVGDNVIMANVASLAGHTELGDWVIIGGLAGIVQFLRVSKHSFITAGTILTKEVPPFIIAHGAENARFYGLNIVGLKRRGFDNERIRKISEVYDLIFKSEYNVSDAVKKIKNEIEFNDDVCEIINFIETSKKGIIKGQ
jgi:UDP-N-acetylglucosamine acyltransferase